LLKPVCVVFLLIYTPWYFLIKYELAFDYRRQLLIWTVLVLFYAVYKYLLWLLNLYLITDRRLVRVSYENLFKKRITESPLNRLTNISVFTSGVFSSVLGHGNVEVKIADSSGTLILENIRQPIGIKDFLWKLSQKIQAKEAARPQSTGQNPRTAKISGAGIAAARTKTAIK
jgi:hypothetical protein